MRLSVSQQQSLRSGTRNGPVRGQATDGGLLSVGLANLLRRCTTPFAACREWKGPELCHCVQGGGRAGHGKSLGPIC